MFSTLRTRFGIPGVISVVALVFALVGGAYAASNSSGGSKATASVKAKKGPKGPKGATGPAGPAGAQGPAGPAGAKGDAGANGSNGAAGATGATGGKGSPGLVGPTGESGPTGATGFSGFTATLPKEKTETGTWSVSQIAVQGSSAIRVPISFPIPLATSVKAVFLNKEETEAEAKPEGCSWEWENGLVAPKAPPGVLCVFTASEEHQNAGGFESFLSPGSEFGALFNEAGPTGTFMIMSVLGQRTQLVEDENTHELTLKIREGMLNSSGPWAVTAP